MADGMSAGVGGVIGSAISGLFGLLGNEQDFDNQKELQEMQNNWNEMMWQKNADWNSPENQMRLMAAAGINPAFAAAGISGNPGYQVPAASTPMHTPTNLGTVLSQAAGGAPEAIKTLMDAKIGGKNFAWYDRLNQAQYDNIVQQTKESCSKSGFNDAQTKQMLEMLEPLKNKTYAEIDQIKQTVQNMVAAYNQINAEIEKTRKETAKIGAETENVEKQTEKLNAEIENVSVDTQLKGAQKNESESKALYNYAIIQKVAAEFELINTQKALAEMQKNESESRIDVNSAEYQNKIKDAFLKDFQIKLAENGYFGFGLSADNQQRALNGLDIYDIFNQFAKEMVKTMENTQKEIETQSRKYKGQNN